MESVYFQAAIGPCDQFVCEVSCPLCDGENPVRPPAVRCPKCKDKGFLKETLEIQVVISPLKVIEEENAVKANYGCNMWKACEQKRCQYSQVSKGPRTEKK